jgi:hypothetical protein
MLFKNVHTESQFKQDGFVVLPLLNSTETNYLKTIFDNRYSQQFNGLQPLLRIGDAHENIKLHHQIGEFLSPILEKWFLPFNFNANHFIVKGAQDSKAFRLHQDWNIVDENNFIAAHIWIALQNTDENNGSLFVLKGSHLYFKNVRSGSCGIAFVENTAIVKAHCTTVNLKAGEAIVYMQSLFHGSHANNSNNPRLICLSSIRPKQVPMVYYHQENEILMEYEITPELLLGQILRLEKGEAPIGILKKASKFKPSHKSLYLGTTEMEHKLSSTL